MYKRIYTKDKCLNGDVIESQKTYFMAHKCLKKISAGNELMFPLLRNTVIYCSLRKEYDFYLKIIVLHQLYTTVFFFQAGLLETGKGKISTGKRY